MNHVGSKDSWAIKDFVETNFSLDAREIFYQLWNMEAFDSVSIGYHCLDFEIRKTYRLVLSLEGDLFWYGIADHKYYQSLNFEKVFYGLLEMDTRLAEEFCFHLNLFK